ncbi:MAG: hypothetical protein AB7P20_07825 [Rhizobiaceae bacterium]
MKRNGTRHQPRSPPMTGRLPGSGHGGLSKGALIEPSAGNTSGYCGRCPICRSDSLIIDRQAASLVEIHCAQCGHFAIAWPKLIAIKRMPLRRRLEWLSDARHAEIRRRPSRIDANHLPSSIASE